MLSKLQTGECNDFWKEIKALIPKNDSLQLTVGWTCGESNIEKKDNLSAIANSVGSTDNRDQVMNALGTVPGHNGIINLNKLLKIARGLKNKKAVCNDGVWSL